MTHLFSLDKKMHKVVIKLTKTEFDTTLTQHNLTPEQLKQNIQQQLYGNFIQALAGKVPTQVYADGDINHYSVTGYILTERDMLYILQECLGMEESMRAKMLKEVEDILYDRVPKDMA